MKYIKRYNSYIINELFVHKENEEIDDKYFILYKKDLWVFSEDEWEEKKLWKDINKALGEDILEDDFWDSFTMLREEHAYILNGKIEDNFIVLNGSDNYRHSNSSIDIKKLRKVFDLPIRVTYGKGVYYGDEGEYYIFELDNFKDSYYYHGTSLKYLEAISKTGIRPMDKNSNYDKINHSDKIFFTSNKERALFHANTAALKTNSFPILLKFKIPDVNKIVIDYDLAMDFYGEDADVSQKLGYSNIKKYSGGFQKDKTIIKDSEKVNILNKMGVFGYLGRIPSSFIEEVLIDIITLQNHLYLADDEISDIYGEELSTVSEVWNEFDDIGVWSEMSIKEVLKRIDNMVEDFLQYDEE